MEFPEILLINENGILTKIISPKTTPLSDEIINWIEDTKTTTKP